MMQGNTAVVTAAAGNSGIAMAWRLKSGDQ